MDITAAEYRKIFHEAAQEAQVMMLSPIPYHLRHTGASMDLTKHWGSVEAVKHRGRWRTDRAMARYLKGGRVANQFRWLPAKVQAHCDLCREHIGEILMGRSKAFGL